MKNLFRTLALLCALALIAAACGGGDDDAADTGEIEDAVSATTAPAEASTTTEAPATTSTTTTEAPPTGPVFPLSGQVLAEGETADHRAVVVKISNNDTTARAALLGLDEADIVFEERIEQDATRFAAVFHSSLPTEVGSVRSGRTSDIDIVSNLNSPVFAYSGANQRVEDQLRSAENNGLLNRVSDQLGNAELSRISGFSAPNNLVADVAAALERVGEGDPPTPIFDYSNNLREIGGFPSAGARVIGRSEAEFVWSQEAGGYLRFEDGQQLVGRDGAPVVSQNVIVLTTTYLPSQIDASSVDAITVGSNPVVVYTGGFRIEGTWTREFARDGYTLETPEGAIIGLAPGQTWVSLAPAGTDQELGQVGANELLDG